MIAALLHSFGQDSVQHSMREPLKSHSNSGWLFYSDLQKIEKLFCGFISLSRLAVLGFEGFLADLKSDHLIIENVHKIYIISFKFS
ncbi:TPA: hypothetical protein ACGVA1_001306 [Vibrio vulnificus]